MPLRQNVGTMPLLTQSGRAAISARISSLVAQGRRMSLRPDLGSVYGPPYLATWTRFQMVSGLDTPYAT